MLRGVVDRFKVTGDPFLLIRVPESVLKDPSRHKYEHNTF